MKRECLKCKTISVFWKLGDNRIKCKNCGGAGYKGRTGIYELLNINDEMAAAIAKNADGNTIASIAKKNGMKTLVEDGMEKIAAGITNEAEVARVTINV